MQFLTLYFSTIYAGSRKRVDFLGLSMNSFAPHTTPLHLFCFIVITSLLLSSTLHPVLYTFIHAGDRGWRKHTSSVPTALTLCLGSLISGEPFMLSNCCAVFVYIHSSALLISYFTVSLLF